MEKIVYPTPEKIIEYNLLVLSIIKVKKADNPKVLSRSKIVDVIEDCKNLDGDIYDRAVFLMKSLVQKHPFASGNRRTAFIVTKDCLIANHSMFNIKDDPRYARVMVGVRERFYKDEEIKQWILAGEIREFKRQ